jgi:chaperonin cofactor prefoldin
MMEEDRTRVVEKTRVVGEEQPPPPPPLPPPPPSQPQPKSSGGHGAVPWKILAIVFAILFAVMLVIAVIYANSYYASLSSASYWQSEYQALESKYNALQSQYNTLQNQYSSLQSQYQSLQTQYNNLQSQNQALQSQYSSLQSQYNTLNSQYQALQAQYGPFQQFVTNFPAFVFLGASYTSATSQWPSIIGSSILLVPSNYFVGGAVLAPSIYTSTGGQGYTVYAVAISGNATSPGGSYSACYQRLSDGFTAYLFVKPSNLLTNTFGTSVSLGLGSEFGGDVVIPYSPSPYIIVEWDPWFGTVTAYVIEWTGTPSTTGMQTSGVTILWENSSSVNIYPSPGDDLGLFLLYFSNNNTLKVMIGDYTTGAYTTSTFVIPQGLIQPSSGIYYVGAGSQTGSCYANWYLNGFGISEYKYVAGMYEPIYQIYYWNYW